MKSLVQTTAAKASSATLWVLVFFFLAGVGATRSAAQEVSAGITGVVTDPSGAAIVAAKVTATNVDQGTEWTTETNEQGIYFFPRLPAGRYEVRVESPGFKTAVRTGLLLEVNQRARVDLTLEIGEVVESVEVTGEAPLLNTDTTLVGQTIDTSTLTEVPLASRNFIELTLLAPGVTVTSLSGLRSGQRSGYGAPRPYVNGNRAQANNFMLDGIDNNQVSDNYTAYNPNPDAIQEVKMITNNAPAEFGNFQGGIINVVIKSGTNAFHGTAFWFLQNDKLNANNWARNWLGLERVPVRWNQFGATFGGPIKRDRLFFFVDYQGLRKNSPTSINTLSLIPAAFRQGDFSRLLTERNTQLYDPMTLDPQGNRVPFAGNQIPLDRIDPVAANLFARQDLYPLPVNNSLELNYPNARRSHLYTDQGDVKIDFKASDADDISFRYSNSQQRQPSQNSFPLLFPGYFDAPFQAGVLNWTRTISPTIVNEARFGVNRIIMDIGARDNGVGNLAEELGIINGNDRGPGLMQLRFQGGLASNIGSNNIGPRAQFFNTTFHWANNLTIVKGRHMIKTGGQILRQRMNTRYTGNTGRTGFIQFNGQFTGSDISAKGFAEADFFLGAVSRIGRGVDNLWGHRKTIFGIYIQDDWRITDNLTLNLGIRWEYHTPLVEVYDRQTNFSPYTGEILLAGQNGNSRALYNPFKKDFQPRVGFAWTVRGNTVIRGAYTISSYMEGTGTNLRLPMNPPWQTEFENRWDDGSVTQPVISTAQGVIAAGAKDPYDGANIRLWDINVRPANTQQWSLIIENQLPGNTVFSVGYVGQHGTHLVTPMPYFQRILNPDGTTSPSPYLSGNPKLKNISQISGTETNSNMIYHGLQVNVRRRMTAGLAFQTSYTFSKTMTDSLGFFGDVGQVGGPSAYWQYLYDKKAEWGPAFFDAKHIWTSSFIYELPFGRGKTYGDGWSPALNAVLGEWQIGGMMSVRSGFAMTVRARDVSGTRSRGARADHVAKDRNEPHIPGPGGQWFDTSAYAQPKPGTLGNAGNGTFRGPGLFDLSVSLQKFFALTEALRLQFRAEAFALTNTPNFQGVVRNVVSSRFGEVRGSQGERRLQFGLKLFF